MSQGAAFFDLDRTLISGASGPVISAALRAVGLLSERRIPGEDLVFSIFNRFGENRPSMLLTRQAVRLAKGWDTEAAREAGAIAGAELDGLVQPYARVLIEQHQADGRPVVLATTTPRHLVEPLAERLGFDGVVATTYAEADGRFTGALVGPFVWGAGKLEGVRTWAEANGVEVEASTAYSDSYYDLPLLSAVAEPVVVNPDPRLRVQALARRWPVLRLDVPAGVPKFLGIEPQEALLPWARPELALFARITVEGTEHIPRHGAAILCGNHRSYFDPLAIGMAIGEVGRPVRFLGKKEVFDAPVVGDLVRAAGGIRVDRGTGSDEPLREAASVLEAGELVAIMPQGTIPRGRAFFDPDLKGRWGAAKLAAMAHVPVIPVGLWGTEKVWPRNAKVPNLLNVLDPPEVLVRVGAPIELGYDDPDADTTAIMAAITELLPPEAREWRQPTPEELARTMPSGATPEAISAEHEAARRPGTD
ncbi:MAG: HAD-IB family hydrolase [Acidimicrobiales bacterium]|nr:HAD-IB family hydrolase [Acidimicrobiales bacterium]MCB1260727.1 HAD-IB family hydrolase [Acidimicrobiales bacterium]